MALVTVEYYRFVTGDDATPNPTVSALVEEAQGLVEDYCHRQLEEATRTEVVTVDQDGYAYPLARPVTSVSLPDGASVSRDGRAIVGVTGTSEPNSEWVGWQTALPFGPDPQLWAEVTYVGGYTSDTCPRGLKRIIARLAKGRQDRPGGSGSSGVKSASVVGVSVTFQESGGVHEVDEYVPGISRLLKPWRFR